MRKTVPDTKIKWQHGHFETSVYRKDSNTDLYIHWESPAPHTWKRSTLRGLVYRAYTVCSEKHLLDQELEHLKTTFAEINGYPTKVIKQVFRQVKIQITTQNEETTQSPNNVEDEKVLRIVLPYQGHQGTKLITRLKTLIYRNVTRSVKVDCVYGPAYMV